MGLGVQSVCLSETCPEQAKKTQSVNGNSQFSKKYGSGPHPQLIQPPKALFKGFPNTPTYPPLQWAQMRQHGSDPRKLRPKRYSSLVQTRNCLPPRVQLPATASATAFAIPLNCA